MIFSYGSMILEPINNIGIDIYSNEACEWSKDQWGTNSHNKYKCTRKLGKYYYHNLMPSNMAGKQLDGKSSTWEQIIAVSKLPVQY